MGCGAAATGLSAARWESALLKQRPNEEQPALPAVQDLAWSDHPECNAFVLPIDGKKKGAAAE